MSTTPRSRAWLPAVAATAAALGIALASPGLAVAQAPGRVILVQDVVGTEEVAPGEVISYQPIVHNGGDTTAEFIALELFDDTYARHTQRFSNCQYQDDPVFSIAFCQFELNLEPGETAQVPAETAVELQVLPNAPQGWRINASYTADGFDGPVGRDDEFGDGPPLRLEKLPDAEFGDGNESFANVLFDVGTNPADLAAEGAEIAGDVGDAVTVGIGVTNHGPADIPPLSPGEGSSEFENQAITRVTFPDGVTVLEILPPEGDLQFTSSCVPVVDGVPDEQRRNEVDGLSYECRVSETALGVEETWRFPFRVEITGSEAATGEVEVSEGANDPDPSNNVTTVTLTPGADGGGGQLPVTGSATGVMAGAGGIALVVGVGLYLLARRRQIRIPTGGTT